MQRLQAFKFRLVPTEEQRSVMERTAGVVRFIWNSALALQRHRLQRRARVLSYADLCKELTAARNTPELGFLAEIHSKPQQQVLKDLSRAFSDFFSGARGFPRFKKKGRHDAFRHPERVRVDGRHVHVPGVGAIRFRKSREVLGTIKNATLSKGGGHWYVSLQTERDVPEPIHPSSSEVGIDMGVLKFAALSTGEDVHPIDSFRRMERQMAVAQRRLRNKKKFGSNWKKQKAVIARLHIRIADARADFLHKTSTAISNIVAPAYGGLGHAVVYIEDLKVKGMSASARGTIAEPGKRVRQKAGLNKAILDQGWFEFRRQLTYKEQWQGGHVVGVPPHHTSQTCSLCQHVAAESRRCQALFVCVACGHEDNADTNAAKNILRAGQALSACGVGPLGPSVKQEPGVGREAQPLAA
jgi:putative transposase